MTYITRRKHAASGRGIPARASLGAALLAGGLASCPVCAQEGGAQPDASPDRAVATLPESRVTGAREGYLEEYVGPPKFTEPISRTPRSVQTINRDLIDSQQATTLTEALRNSPGVGTFSVGENGVTSSGDAVFLRGFDSSGAIFVDGARDLGAVSRDMFNVEQVDVFQGPSSTDFGRVTAGGAINLQTKRAQAGNHAEVGALLGTGSQKRATADINRDLGNGAALRLNVMGQDSGVPGRDVVKNRRWGVAPSLTLGLGAPTRIHLDYMHLHQNNIPDGGVATVGLPGWTSPDPARPELGDAPRPSSSNFYGTRNDYDKANVDMLTASIEHDISPDITLFNTTRYARTRQKQLVTAFLGSMDHWSMADLESWTLGRLPNTRDTSNSILTNQTTVVQQLQTGSVDHTLSYGLELTREKVKKYGLATPVAATFTPPFTWPVNVYDPVHSATSYYASRNGADGSGTTDTAALYLFDTMKFSDRLRVVGGARFDHYRSQYSASAVCGSRGAPPCGSLPAGTLLPSVDGKRSGNLLSWQLGGVYNLTEQGNVYASYSTGKNPPGGQDLTFSSRDSSGDNPAFEPQKYKTMEVGTKWNLAGERLLLTAALYRTEVDNLVEQDPVDQSYYQTGKKRVQGIQLSAVGRIRPNWNVSAGLITLDAKVKRGASEVYDGSEDFAFTPRYAFTSWSTYRFDSGLTLGGGLRYMGGFKRGRASNAPMETSAYWVADAMLGYEINKKAALQLNVYNLFNKDYVASLNRSGIRYMPGPKRSAVLSVNFTF